MNQNDRRRLRVFRPEAEACESRQLLSAVLLGHHVPLSAHPLYQPGSDHPVRPNTPVLPYAADYDAATFIDPSVKVVNGSQITLNRQCYVAPYASLNATGGYIEIGKYVSILDNASLTANPTGPSAGLVGQHIGDQVVIAQGARVLGASAVGTYGDLAKPTYIGPNATVDNATLEPGAYVSAMAYVGPGVTVPSGYAVLPGASVTTEAEATDPALGKVEKMTKAQLDTVIGTYLAGVSLAKGYTTVYQGNKATGPSPGTNNPNIFNGDLSLVLGAGPDAGKSVVPFENSTLLPWFPKPSGRLTGVTVPQIRLRIIGNAVFHQRLGQVAHHSGRSDSVRADVGQPVTIGSIASLGNSVSIHAPVGGKLTIGNNFVAQDHAVILGGKKAVIGDNVTVGTGSVLDNASVGSGSVIGAGSYLQDVTIPAGSVVPPGTFLIGKS